MNYIKRILADNYLNLIKEELIYMIFNVNNFFSKLFVNAHRYQNFRGSHYV